jgi:effector-binding domain-containing protein
MAAVERSRGVSCRPSDRRVDGTSIERAALLSDLVGGFTALPAFQERWNMAIIQQRDVPEQLVLTEQRNLRAPDLSEWLRGAMERLGKAAQEYGGLAGSWFVVYHGQLTEDSEVPVEVCAPISPSQRESSAAAMRHEPAHREAYVRLKKAEVVFPQIQSKYAAVERWARSERLEIAGPAREVYFTDFFAARPTDEVLDVAFPIR